MEARPVLVHVDVVFPAAFRWHELPYRFPLPHIHKLLRCILPPTRHNSILLEFEASVS